MARKLNIRNTGSALPGLDDFTDLPQGTRRSVPFEKLSHFPGNEELVGVLPEKQKNALREDILKNGIREALQIWPVDSKLLVVSGNERLGILKSLPAGKRPAGIACEIKHFESWAEARNHVISVNENRKSVKLAPVDRLIRVFPPAEHPWLWANLRARSDEFQILSLPTGNHKLERPVIADVARSEQAEARAHACTILGWSDAFLKKTLSLAGKKIKSDPSSPENGTMPLPSRISSGIIKSIKSRVDKNPEVIEWLIRDLAALLKELKAAKPGSRQ